MKKTFVSNNSFSDALMKCKLSGYNPVGQIYNQKMNQYLVFGRKMFQY
jgi:hypothetical protein